MIAQKKILAEGFWILSGQFFSILGSLLLVKILTEAIDPSDYGRLALALSYGFISSQALIGPIASSLKRYYSIAKKNKALDFYFAASKKITKKAILLLTAISIIAVLFTYVIADLYSSIEIACAALLSLIVGCNSIVSAIQNAARQRSVVAVYSGINSISKVFFVWIFGLFLHLNSIIILCLFSVIALIVLCMQWKHVRKEVTRNSQSTYRVKEWENKLWHYSIPFLGWGIISWVQQNSDKWALGFLSSTEEVAKYAVLFQLGYLPIAILSGILIDLLEPIFFEYAEHGSDYKKNLVIHGLVLKIAFAVLIFSAVFFVALFFSHELIFSIFVSKKYSVYSYLLPYFVLAGGLFAGGQVITIKFLSKMQARKIFFLKLCTSVLGVFINLTFAAIWGLVGVVIALVTFSLIYFIWMVVLVLQDSKKISFHNIT